MGRLERYLKAAKSLKFPGFRQAYNWNCGTTAISMILAYMGIDVGEGEIMKLANVSKENGAPIEGLKKAAKHYGLKFKEGHFTSKDLREHVDNGWPTLLMIQAWSSNENPPDWKNEWDQGHYTVCIGYDDERLFFADPINVKRTYLTDGELNSRWHGWDDEGKKINRWGIVFTKKGEFEYDQAEQTG
jgi:ABC-type bacteriocin/lantibiotic exporter with double-glycine peptidase domain